MIALGVDPGTRRVGYGIVERRAGALSFLDAGLLALEAHSDLEVFGEIKKQLVSLVKRFHPDVLAVEKLFFSKNQKTGIAVAQARGAVLLTANECGIRIREYGPSEVKMGLTGYGGADKRAVAKMVRLALHMPHLRVADDASDALALAILSCSRTLLTER